MRNLRNFLSSSLKSRFKRRLPSAKRSRNQTSLGRRLSSETLEKRELLAGDLVGNANHNYLSAYDVNADNSITVGDALIMLNSMSSVGPAGEAAALGDDDLIYPDVNNDGRLTASDALGVINAVGRGEGVGELVEMFLTARDADDNAIDITDGEYNIAVGEKFNLEIAYSDRRTPSEAKGAFQIKADVIANLPDYLVPVMTETQRFRYDSGVDDPSVSELQSVTFTEEGTGLSYVSPAESFRANKFIEIATALSTFGYTFNSDYEYTPSLTFDDGDRGFLIHWIGDTYDDVDVPNIEISIQQNGGAVLEASMAEFSPYLSGPDTVMGTADDVPNSSAVQFNLDTDVRTWSQFYSGGNTFYDTLNSGEFDTQRDDVPPRPGYINVGGVGQLNENGLSGVDPGFTGITPNDAFSLPVKLVQPVQGLILNLAPSFDMKDGVDTNEAVLLYGESSALTPADVILDSYDGVGDPPVDTNGTGVAYLIINAIGENRDPEISDPITKVFSQDDSLTNVDLLEFASDPDNNTLSVDTGTVSFDGNLAGILVSGNEAIVDPTLYSYLALSEQEVITISYDIVDGAGGSVAQTATITINGLNDPATGVTGDTTGSVTEDGTLIANGSLSVVDPDTGEDEVQPQATSSGTYGTFSILASGSWTYSLNNADSVVQALSVGAAPTDTFTVTSKDGSATVDVIITINGVNDAPTKGAQVTATFSEENEPTSVDLLTGASDVDQGDVIDVANYVVASGNAVGVSRDGNNVEVDPGAYGFLEDGQSEVVVLNYDIVDGNGGSVDQTATITVTGVSNFSPVITVEVGDGVTGEVSELAVTPTAASAISGPAGGLVSAASVGPGVGHNYGWGFTVDKPIKISELGAFADSNFVSVNAAATNPDKIRVGLWDVSTGKRMTYVDLKRSDYGGQANQFVYKDINPIPLPAGGSYRISVTSVFVPLEFYSGSGSQTMEGTGVFSNFEGGFVGQFSGASQYPSELVTGQSGGFVGGNFQWYEDTKHTVGDTLSFSDADPTDTHLVSTEATEADYVGTFSAEVTTLVLNGDGGKVTWNFSALDAELDELAQDEVRQQIYDVTVTDSNGGTDVEQVTITLTGVNDQPTVLEPIERVFNSGMSAEDIDLLTGAFDVDGDGIGVEAGSVVVSGNDTTGVSVNQNQSIATVTPGAYASLDADEQEIVDVTYNVVDDNGAVVEQTAKFIFNGLNDPPTPGSPIFATFSQNDSVSNVSLIAGATDPEEDTLTIADVSFNPVNPSGFEIVNNDSVEVTPAAYESLNVGEDVEIQINYVIDDGAGNQTSQQTATITITGANDTATIEGDATGNVVEDTAVTDGQLTANGTLSVSDVDTGQALFSTLVTDQVGNLGSLVITEVGVWSYVLDNSLPAVQQLGAGSTLTDTFTVESFDGTATKNIAITITGVNDVAVISGDNEGGVTEDDSNTLTTSGILSVTDVDAGESAFANTVLGVDSPLGTLVISPAGEWDYTLDNALSAVQALPDGATIVDKFEVKSFDQSASEIVTVTITGINDVPVFSGDIAGSVIEDAGSTLTTTGALTIVDVDTGESSADGRVVPTGETLGTLVVLPGGTWTYEAVNSQDDIQALVDNQSIVETFTITSFDGSKTQVVTITINGTNDVPEAVDEERLALKDGDGILVDVLANDNAGAGGLEDLNQSISIVIDSLELSESATAGSPNGTVEIEDGKIRYVPGAGFEGTATIDYEVSDGELSAAGTLTVVVVDFVPSMLSGGVFIDHVENFRDVRDNGADPIRNGVKDDDENGFASVRIKLVSSDNYTNSSIEREVLTDADGNFEFTDVVPGEYKVIYEYPEQVRYEGSGEYDVSIPALGDVQRNDFNFGLTGTQGAAMTSVGLLASSYLRTDATISQISDGGREGGLVCLDSSGQQSFLVLGSGFEGVQFAELELNATQDAALLTLLTQEGDLLSTILTEEFFVVSNDQCGIQFFGSLNDHFFTEAGSTNGTTFDNTRTAVEDYQDNNSPE